jgi:hypothetical protein
MCGPGRRGLGALGDGPGPGRPVLRQSLPTCHFENGTVINVATCLEARGLVSAIAPERRAFVHGEFRHHRLPKWRHRLRFQSSVN